MATGPWKRALMWLRVHSATAASSVSHLLSFVLISAREALTQWLWSSGNTSC